MSQITKYQPDQTPPPLNTVRIETELGAISVDFDKLSEKAQNTIVDTACKLAKLRYCLNYVEEKTQENKEALKKTNRYFNKATEKVLVEEGRQLAKATQKLLVDPECCIDVDAQLNSSTTVRKIQFGLG